ncbi:MAG TPA: hypothetical protein VGA00_12470 [Acidiferrobacterales bacterium]|jgi:hypothetical protein
MTQTPRWMHHVMRAAGLYNLGYGLLLAAYPAETFAWLGMPETPEIMIRCIGMMVGVYALCYWIAGSDPVHYWPLVAVGIVGKTLGPVGFLHGSLTGVFAAQGWIMIFLNDIIWWLPFWWIVLHAWDREPDAWRVMLFGRCASRRGLRP